MNELKEIYDRIKWLKIELIHHGYLDGFTILKYEDELKQLEKKIQEINEGKV